MVICFACAEKLLVQEDPALFTFINQGCLSVDGMDDQEEMKLADVCKHSTVCNTAPCPHSAHTDTV